jgi:hypothetical protein
MLARFHGEIQGGNQVGYLRWRKSSGRQFSQVGGCCRQRVCDGGIVSPCRHAAFAVIALVALVGTLVAIARDAIVTNTATTGVLLEQNF